MFKKVLIPVFFTIIVFILLIVINNINNQQTNNRQLKENTPTKFVEWIYHKEQTLDNPTILFEHLQQNIYRQYELNQRTFGFIAGIMGYEEDILVYVELEYVDSDFIQVNQVDILYENETDGYGDYLVEPWFLDRFKQKTYKNLSLVKRKKTNDNQIIAITGATITSEAIVRVVNDCRKIMEDSENE